MTKQSYFKRGPVKTIEDGPTALYLKLTVGATGAVSATSGFGLAATNPIVRNSAGNYTITLDRAYKKLLSLHHTTILASPQGLTLTVTADNITASGALTVEFSLDGVATDPSSGALVIFEVLLADTALNGGIA